MKFERFASNSALRLRNDDNLNQCFDEHVFEIAY